MISNGICNKPHCQIGQNKKKVIESENPNLSSRKEKKEMKSSINLYSLKYIFVCNKLNFATNSVETSDEIFPPQACQRRSKIAMGPEKIY